MMILRNILVAGLLTAWPIVGNAAGTSFFLQGASAAPVEAPAGPVSPFTVADGIQVPGKKLAAGAYTIRVLDHLSDRMILRVDRKGKPQSTFLALPKSGLTQIPTKGPIVLGSGARSAMRGFVFADGTVAEFVYPKLEAVGLAKANDTTIPAIDPASEGRTASSDLSSEDLQMVTLWMLSPKPVSPGDAGPGVQAAKYQAPLETASASMPPRPKARPKPVMAALPHTAGEMPIIELAGLLSLVGAGWLTRRRM